jgi:sugar O-acyltransferase (sialic acid O-acetyltransferase NeuD family)
MSLMSARSEARTGMSEVVLVGAGGFARETAAAVHAINEREPRWRLRGFLDDDLALHGTQRGGVPVLGPLDAIADLPDAAVVICVGNPRNFAAREQIAARLDLPAARYATIIHPTASVGPDCLIGPGSVLLAQTALTAAVTIGAHTAVMPQAVLTHDGVIGNFVTIASGVRLGGGVVIEDGAYLGAGSLLREFVHVGAGALVGMGSVVLGDVPAKQVWAGNPARYLRDV